MLVCELWPSIPHAAITRSEAYTGPEREYMVAGACQLLGNMLTTLRRLDEGEALLRRSLEIYERLSGEDGAYTADLRPDRIAEFLVLNPSFPHSIRFSADALETAMKQVGAEVSSRRSARVERIAGRMQATLAFGQIDGVQRVGHAQTPRQRFPLDVP